jgi:hypothetical protein
MSVTIPPILVLIVCKTISAGPIDDVATNNARFTQWENLTWATEHSMMVCRRNEIQLYDSAEGMKLNEKDDPVIPLNPNFADKTQCARAGIRLAMDWDQQHKNSRWRVWRVGCPTPMVDTNTGEIVGYQLPDCGHRDTVICETDSVI